jgi:ABC-type transport system involved in multi-copper enzyme maturation permease subunit
MNELVIQVRKDLNMLSTDARFVFLIVALAAIAFILSFVSCSNYISTTRYESITTASSVMIGQKINLGQFWGSLLMIDTAIFIVAGSLAMSAEKDGGMLRYILTSKCDKKMFFFSKFLVLTMMVAIAVSVSLVAYIITFAMMDMPSMGLEVLLFSMLFPTLTLLVFASLGLLLTTISKKKAVSIILAIFLFFFLSTMYSMTMSMGSSEAYRANEHVTIDNVTDFIPMAFKVLDLSNPLILVQGTYLTLGLITEDYASTYSPPFFDLWGGLALGLAMLIILLGIGYLAFRTERLDGSGGNQGLIGRLLAR